MKTTVLICTYSRKALLNKCLKTLIEESIELPDEIVVVDGDEGGAADIVSTWREKFHNIKLIPTKNVNLAVSRNIGLPHCSGDIVALTDDDVQVSPDWISRIRQLHKEHPEAGMVGGKIKSVGDKFIDRIAELVIFPSPKKSGSLRTIAAANASYKKEAIEKTGEYDRSLFRGEDVDYNWRILNLGYTIHYDPHLVVYHHHRATWRNLFYQIFMYGRAYYLVRKKWKEMYCVYPHGVRKIEDVLKLGNSLVGVLYEPLLLSLNMKSLLDRLFGYPVLVAGHLFWKCGMVRQGSISFIKKLL